MTGVKALPSIFVWNVAWFVDLTGIVRGAAEVRTMPLTITILTFDEWPTVLHIMVIGTTPYTEKGVMVGVIGPEVIKVVATVVDLVIGHVGKGG